MGRFHGVWANLIGALLGTVTPFCSCSSIPIFMGFTSAGLPLGVTFSFLISSPMVDLGSLVLLMGIFGYRIALVYVAAGLLIAVCGGTLIEHMHMEDQVEDFIRNASSAVDITAPDLTIRDRMIYARDQVVSTFRKVFPYILLGVGIGAVIHNWIPQHVVETVLGNRNPLGVILATLVGVPMYADIFGTIPVAEALLSKGALLGTVLSFMMAVTTLSLPSLIMLRKAIKPKLLTAFIVICIAGIIIVGYGFNLFQGALTGVGFCCNGCKGDRQPVNKPGNKEVSAYECNGCRSDLQGAGGFQPDPDCGTADERGNVRMQAAGAFPDCTANTVPSYEGFDRMRSCEWAERVEEYLLFPELRCSDRIS